MLTVEVVEVILVWIWDIVEIVYLFDGGRFYLGWLWRGGSLFLYLVNSKADIAGRRRHVERVGVLWRRGDGWSVSPVSNSPHAGESDAPRNLWRQRGRGS